MDRISYLSRVFIGLIKLYRLAIRPYLPSACRFSPSCSEYAMQALYRFGIGKGIYFTARRLLKCHPACSGGFDPVPPLNFKKEKFVQ